MDTPLPWQLLQSMSTIADMGSLSAAARHMGVSQPTLSRHMTALEEIIGNRIFLRTSEGMQLTAQGEQLYADVRQMADTVGRITNRDDRNTGEVSGTVRISASQIISNHVLPKMLTELHQSAPRVSFEVVASDSTQNLIRREADIAIRMYRPDQSDLFIKKVAELELGIFAHRSYIADKDEITIENFMSHDVIGYDRSTLIIDGMRRVGMNVDRDDFSFRSDDQVVCWNMVRAGYGIGMMQVGIAEQDPNLIRIAKQINIGSMPVWLAAHKELKSSPRFRLIFDHLAASFGVLS